MDLKKQIITWTSRLGYVLLLIAILSLLTELLPIDFWITLNGLFSNHNTTTYYKIVPTEGNSLNFIIIGLIGIVLILIEKNFSRFSGTP